MGEGCENCIYYERVAGLDIDLESLLDDRASEADARICKKDGRNKKLTDYEVGRGCGNFRQDPKAVGKNAGNTGQRTNIKSKTEKAAPEKDEDWFIELEKRDVERHAEMQARLRKKEEEEKAAEEAERENEEKRKSEEARREQERREKESYIKRYDNTQTRIDMERALDDVFQFFGDVSGGRLKTKTYQIEHIRNIYQNALFYSGRESNCDPEAFKEIPEEQRFTVEDFGRYVDKLDCSSRRNELKGFHEAIEEALGVKLEYYGGEEQRHRKEEKRREWEDKKKYYEHTLTRADMDRALDEAYEQFKKKRKPADAQAKLLKTIYENALFYGGERSGHSEDWEIFEEIEKKDQYTNTDFGKKSGLA